ncbi:MAG: LamG-like jellyroll fold domain-containing protein [Akkermansiaceae bacterium]
MIQSHKKFIISLILCAGTIAYGQTDTYPEFLYHDGFDGDGLSQNIVKGGGMINASPTTAEWSDDGDATYSNNGTSTDSRAIIYTENTFQSDTGFRLHVKYNTGRIGNIGSHNFSFGLVRSDADLSNYNGTNPFRADRDLYSIGANLTTNGGASSRGLNFTNNNTFTTLDTAGTRQQFGVNDSSEVTIEIGVGGYWCYRINGEYEASGALPDDFDLDASYHIVVYGQSDSGQGKTIESITLKKGYANGERAAGLRGNWNAGQGDAVGMDAAGIRTVDSTIVRLNEGATGSARHNAPHNLLESIALGESIVGGEAIDGATPLTWGDLNDDDPDVDAFMDEVMMVRNLEFGVKIYSNSENFIDQNAGTLAAIADRWFEWCDTDPVAQAFIDSQPYHTGIWNSATQQYEDATVTFPKRKYMFCYAEFILREYALRYAKHASSWTFDSAADIARNGDNASTGNIEDQRIFQAFANAVHAGNPEVPIAFNRGRLNNDLIDDPSFPFARSSRFDDYTFGHAFNGNDDHASDNVNPNRQESIFVSNYRHISTMTATNGYVQAGGDYEWDDLIVGNYHSKLGPGRWQYSTPSAWTQDEFNQWNLEAMQAGGHMTWEGSVPQSANILRDWAIELIKNTDDHLAEFESPNTPGWARKYTDLPEATQGEPYYHVLEEGVDFWDPEGDNIVSINGASYDFFSEVPSWLSITESSTAAGMWIFSGIPPVGASEEYSFNLVATDSNGYSGSRKVALVVNQGLSDVLAEARIANWSMDELSGNQVADTSGNEYHGTLINGSWSCGPQGGAIYLNGEDSEVTLPVAAFSGISDTFSLAMWAKGGVNDAIRRTAISAYDADGNRVINLHLPWIDSQVIWDAGNQGGTYDRASVAATEVDFTDIWNHWVFTKNAISGEMKIYANGKLLHTSTGKTKTLSAIASVTLGSSGNPGGYHEGMFDEVQLYSTELSSEEITYLAGSYGYYNRALVADWTLDDGSGTQVSDVSENAYHGSLENGIWVTGIEGSALDFNGVNTEVSLPASAFAEISDEIAISLWAFGGENQPRNDTSFYANNAEGDRILNIHIPWNSSIVFWDAGYDGSDYDRITYNASESEIKGQWNHWVFSKDSTGVMAIYLNGALVQRAEGLSSPMNGIVNAYLGSTGGQSSVYEGLLDEVKLFDSALSIEEIENLYNRTDFDTCATPLQLWLASHGNDFVTSTEVNENGDADGDGYNNLYEYAFGGNPNVEDTISPVSEVGSHTIKIYRRVEENTGLTYELQQSSDLQSWQSVTSTQVETLSTDGSFEEVEISRPNGEGWGDGVQHFLRVHATYEE